MSWITTKIQTIKIINKILNVGNVYKIKGKSAYSYTIRSDLKGLIKVVYLIFGYMSCFYVIRPKRVQLYKLIDWISTKGKTVFYLSYF